MKGPLERYHDDMRRYREDHGPRPTTRAHVAAWWNQIVADLRLWRAR